MLLIDPPPPPARAPSSDFNRSNRVRWSQRIGAARVLRRADVRCSITGCGLAPKFEVVGCSARVAPDLESARILIDGVRRCASARCPWCAPGVAKDVGRKLRLMLKAARAKGIGVAFLTLTAGHDADTLLEEMRDDLGKGFTSIQQGRPYRRLKDGGLAGIARVWDLTGGYGGWHLHPHCLVFHEGGTDAAVVAAHELSGTWMRLMRGRGYRVVAAAQHVRSVETDDRIAGYGVETLQHWGPDAELAAGIAKVGKRSGRLTLPQILNRALDGDAWAAARYVEAATALLGQRTLVVGKVLKAKLGVDFDEDDEVPEGDAREEEPPAEPLGTLSGATWNKACKAGLVPQVLDIIERYAALDRVPWSQVWPLIDDYVWRGVGPPSPGQVSSPP